MSITPKTQVATAIDESTLHNGETVHIDCDDQDEYEQLCFAVSIMCEDDVEYAIEYGVKHEYWGDDEGSEWSIHVSIESL